MLSNQEDGIGKKEKKRKINHYFDGDNKSG